MKASCRAPASIIKKLWSYSVCLLTESIIKEIPEIRAVSKREKGTFAVTIGKLIGEICACISGPENQRNRVKVTGPTMFICHD
ncbi:predicted protein [Methanosarcina acetivorans C2A]|uniref:Uncharacterized protein n=1 Tax=Methanosarcina acetivorans (strain ATCC 35395 / DSM 2834 / JCM 12185 / C2A) TaxID=188937 RepID=Q8TSR3_METAC|nr:predicted protein [Methanosarcina acetivorans C2A]